MTNNEIKLTKLIESLNSQLRTIKTSDEYVFGKLTLKIKPLRYVVKKIRKIKNSRKPQYKTKDLEKDLNEIQNKRIVIYTCITGNYDSPIQPLYKNDNYDYILITNNKNTAAIGWDNVIFVENNGLNDTELNRYYKMHPQDRFSSYDYSIYIDGNLEILSDLTSFIPKIDKQYGFALSMHPYRQDIIKEIKTCKKYKKGNYQALKSQAQQYIKNGFPKNYGLLEAPVIATNLKNPNAIDILNQWWEEFLRSKSKRDQISLPYILWKNHIPVDKIGTLSNDIFHSEKFGDRKEHNHK